MAELVKVKVLRALGGYAEGDERDLSPADAKRLESRGVVTVIKAKARPVVENKMATTPANKSATKKGA